MTKKVSLNEVESWEKATELNESLGTIETFFPAAVRHLVKDADSGQLKPVAKYLVARVMRGQNMLSMLYHASSVLREENVYDAEQLTLGDMLNWYNPRDVAALMSTYFLYRRCRSRARLSNREIQDLLPNLMMYSAYGAYSGAAISQIGLCTGLMVGTIPILVQIEFYMKFKDQFPAYVKHLAESNKFHDPYYETEHFGCSALQLSAVFLSAFGFGRPFAELFMAGLDPQLRPADVTKEQLEPYQYTLFWIQGHIKQQAQPLESMPGQFYPLTEARECMEAQVEAFRGGEPHWLEVDANDVSEEATPKLILNAAKVNEELPDQLRDVFSMEEVAEMEEMDFDNLVDAIDEDEAEAEKEAVEKI